MRSRALLVLAALALVIASQPATAHHGCHVTTSQPTLQNGSVYVVYDVFAHGGIYPLAFLVYYEVNKMPGLQRNDFWHSDTCGNSNNADAIIFDPLNYP